MKATVFCKYSEIIKAAIQEQHTVGYGLNAIQSQKAFYIQAIPRYYLEHKKIELEKDSVYLNKTWVINDSLKDTTKEFSSMSEPLIINSKLFNIPDAKFYVLSNDAYVTYIVPCEDVETVERVVRYAKKKGDQSYVAVIDFKPKPRKGVLYSLVENWIRLSKEGN